MTEVNLQHCILKAAAWSYQIKDSILFNGQKYDIEKIISNHPITCEQIYCEFEPCYKTPSCWRGYQCDYVIEDKLLFLLNLNINDSRNNYQPFMGKVPDLVTPAIHFKASYKNIFYNLKFTGILIAVRNLLNNKISYKEKTELWRFEEVIELYFKDGILTKKVNKSKKLKGLREFEEAKKDILKTKIGKQILYLCCQWIENNKENIYCDTTVKVKQTIIKSYLAREKLLTTIADNLLNQNNNIIKDKLLLEIIDLCNQWIIANINYCRKSTISKRILTKEQKIRLLVYYLIGNHTYYGKNIKTYLDEIYPNPHIEQITFSCCGKVIFCVDKT